MFNFINLKYSVLSAIFVYNAIFSATATHNEVHIRVAIMEGSDRVEITGTDLIVQSSSSEKDTGDRVLVEIKGDLLKVNGKKLHPPLRFRADEDFIYVNDRQYRGEIVLHLTEDGILAVDELPLETYLVGLINAEASSKWPIEALKAQAVVARTFALKKSEERRSKLFDLRDDVSDQVYPGSALEDPESVAAVEGTRSQALTWRGELINAYYHSTCGGHTASSAEVWGTDFQYLSGVACDWCIDSPRYFWKLITTGEELGRGLSRKDIKVGDVTSIRPLETTPSGRVARLEIAGDKGRQVVDAAVLRAAIGYTKIFSTKFMVAQPEEGQFVFMGQGSGHGVGMCQYGARGMALASKNYREILSFYYPGAELTEGYGR